MSGQRTIRVTGHRGNGASSAQLKRLFHLTYGVEDYVNDFLGRGDHGRVVDRALARSGAHPLSAQVRLLWPGLTAC